MMNIKVTLLNFFLLHKLAGEDALGTGFVVCGQSSYSLGVFFFVKSNDHMAVMAVPLIRGLVSGLSPPRPGFTPCSVHMGFEVDKVALRQVFLRVLRFILSV
jgi:hypothetical protein